MIRGSCIAALIVSLCLLASMAALAQRPELIVQTGHYDSVLSVAFSPDGKTIATAGHDDTIKLWDVAARRELRTIWDTAEAIAFSPDGTLLAGGSRLKYIKLWDVTSGEELRTLNGHTELVNSVAFSPDGKLLASGSYDNTIRLWDVSTGSLLETLKRDSSGVNSVAFSPDGHTLASGNADKTIRLWNLSTGTELRMLGTHADAVREVVFSPDGKLLASGSDDKTVSLWDTSTGQHLLTLKVLTNNVFSVAFSPDGKALASTDGNSIKLWDVASGRQLRTLGGNAGSIFQIKFSPDGKLLASAGGTGKSDPIEQGVSHLWDIASGRLAGTLGSHIVYGGIGLFSPDHKLFAVGRVDKTIKVWDMTGADEPLRTFKHTDAVLSVAFSADGKLLAGAAQDGTVKVWDVTSGQEIRTIKGNDADVLSLTFSPDGKMLASSRGNYVDLWDISSGTALRELSVESAWIYLVAFSPDGKLVAGLSKEKKITLWDVATGQELAKPADIPSWVKIPLIGKINNQTIRADSRSTRTTLIDVSTKQELASLIALDEKGWVVVTPDGLFDGSPAAWNNITWRFNNNTFDYKPVEAYFNEFYYPGLLAEIFAGKHPRAATDISAKDRRQPQLRLVVAETQTKTQAASTTRHMKITMNVSEVAGDKDHKTGSGAQDVRLFRNGSLVKVWRGDVLKGQRSVTLEATVPIVAGENKFTAYAFNDHNIKSSDAELIVTGAESLKRQGTAYILAVGVNNYANEQYNLKYAVADAEDFATEVKRQQESLKRYAKVEVSSLADSQATKANIAEKLAELAKQVQPEDAVIVFFAGHGTAQGNQFYLIPHDLGYDGPRENLAEAGLQKILAHSVSDRELEKLFEPIDAGQLLLVIDACNSGQALEAEEKRRGPMNSKGLAQLAYEKGMYVLTASQSYQAAQEAAKFGHGFLTYALVEEGLKQGAADREPKNGSIDIREWLNFATDEVPKMQEQNSLDALRGRGRFIPFVFDGHLGIPKTETGARDNVQRPRVFFRRELEANPLVIASVSAGAPK